MKKLVFSALVLSMSSIMTSGHALTVLSDTELSDVEGQALLNLANSYDSSQGLNFHKMSIQALMELNLNVKTLQLGCGGDKGAGCDIDISNIALSGLNPRIDTDGNPVFDANGRPSSSASITNPFIEFAIKGNSAATREVVGFRVGAEQMLGLLTLGTDNVQNPTDGIKSFSGYMKMAQTQGESLTQAAKFGLTNDQKISGNLRALSTDRRFTSKPGAEGHTGISVPAMKVNFTMPETMVSGSRMSSARVSGIRSSIPRIPLAGSGMVLIAKRRNRA